MGRLGQYRVHNRLWQGATSHSVWPPVLCQDAGGGLAYQWVFPGRSLGWAFVPLSRLLLDPVAHV